MNERDFARFVRRALDESTERLPVRITHRLARARAAAVACASAAERARRATPIAARLERRRDADPAARAPRLWWRLAAVVVPIVVLGAGLVGIAAWQTQQRADDLAELDAAMLTDDVPISAYADRGFGVYLQNVSQQQRVTEP